MLFDRQTTSIIKRQDDDLTATGPLHRMPLLGLRRRDAPRPVLHGKVPDDALSPSEVRWCNTLRLGGDSVVSISFRVYGIPVPQGSMKAFLVKGRPIITSASKGLGAWRNQIADEARKQMNATPIWEDAVRVTCAFYWPRPKSLKKSMTEMITRPDADKLVRCVLDSLSGIVFRDDAQVMDLHVLKLYANAMNPPGVFVLVQAV